MTAFDLTSTPLRFNQKEIDMNTQAPKTPRINNTMPHADVYRLTRWIEVNQASLKGKTQQTIADEVSAATSLKVTVSNIRGVAETLNIGLGFSHSGKRIPNDTNRILARALRELYKRLGEEVPTAIEEIASR